MAEVHGEKTEISVFLMETLRNSVFQNKYHDL